MQSFIGAPIKFAYDPYYFYLDRSVCGVNNIENLHNTSSSSTSTPSTTAQNQLQSSSTQSSSSSSSTPDKSSSTPTTTTTSTTPEDEQTAAPAPTSTNNNTDDTTTTEDESSHSRTIPDFWKIVGYVAGIVFGIGFVIIVVRMIITGRQNRRRIRQEYIQNLWVNEPQKFGTDI